MKAEELRIGNWIRIIRSLPTQVTGYHLFMMQTYTPLAPNEADYKEMTEPIPLTEEWLIKFGFKKELVDAVGIAQWHEYHLDSVEVFNDGTECSELFFIHNSNRTEVKYVHQLQNLYFALTGEELTIKE